MSAQYTAEPPTEGSLEMRTTHGPLHMALWPHDAPSAARLFVRHVASNVFAGLAFHRIVPDLLVQSGNVPSNRSLSTRPVRAERNTRLKFRRRALVALVSDADADTNATSNHKTPSSSNTAMVYDQFFITLADAPFLNGCHPIVATVTGDSVFNLLNIAAHGPVDDPSSDDVPRILHTTLTQSPFPDIAITTLPISSPAAPSVTSNASKNSRLKKPLARTSMPKAIRADSLLSFRADRSEDDDDDDDDDDDVGANLNPRLLRRGIQQRNKLRPAVSSSAQRTEAVRPKTSQESDPPPAAVQENMAQMAVDAVAPTADVVATANAEFERLRRELLQQRDVSSSGDLSGAPRSATSDGAATSPTGTTTGPENVNGPATNLSQADVGSRKRKRRSDEGEVLRRLRAFETRLADARRRTPGSPSGVVTPPSGASVTDAADSAVTPSAATHPEGAPWFSTSLRLRPPNDDLLDYDVVDHAQLRQQRRGPSGTPHR